MANPISTLRVTTRGNRYYVKGKLAGREIKKSLKLRVLEHIEGHEATTAKMVEARIEAERRRAAVEAALLSGAGPTHEPANYTFGEIARLYLSKPEGVANHTYDRVMRLVKMWDKTMVGRMSGGWIEEELRRAKPGWKPGTLKREISVVRAIINYAADRGKALRVKIPTPVVRDERERFLTEEERERLLAVCEEKPHLWRFVLFLVFTGARAGEAWQLEWSDVLEDGVLLTTRKTRGAKPKRRKVPLHPRVKAMLDAMPGTRTGRVFRTSRGTFMHAPATMRLAFDKMKVKAGLGRDVTLHTLRHTFASLMVMKGAPLEVVSKLLGHSNLAQTLRYAHLSPSSFGKAVELL